MSRWAGLFGALLGGVVAEINTRDIFLVQAAFSSSALAVLLAYQQCQNRELSEDTGRKSAREKLAQQEPAHSIAEVLHASFYGLWTAGTYALMLNGCRQTWLILLPMQGREAGLSKATIGGLVAAGKFVDGLVGMTISGELMDRWGRRSVGAPAMIIISLAYWLSATASGCWGIFGASLLFGLGNGLTGGIASTLSADLAPSWARAQFMGLWKMVTSNGSLLFPMLFGLLASQLHSLDKATYLLQLLGVAAALWLWFLVPETCRDIGDGAVQKDGKESLLNEPDRQKLDLNARADLGTTDGEPVSPVSPTAGEAVCRDPGKLQTALEAAQGVLLDVEVQWGQGELTKISPEAAPAAGIAHVKPNKETRFVDVSDATAGHPLSVPGGKRDWDDEDTEVLQDVVPAARTVPPSKTGINGWVSEGEGAVPEGQTEVRKTLLQRAASYFNCFSTDDDEDKRRKMRRGTLYHAQVEEQEVKLDEEVYDVANFYKKTGVWQAMARNDKFERLTLMVICINAIYIGVDADNNKASTTISAEWPYQVCDHAFCLFFTFELAVRFAAFERKRNCLRDMWFIFDTTLVILMVFETWILSIVLLIVQSADGGGVATGPLRLLRLLRLSRLVRLLRSLPELLTLVNGMRAAARAVISALMLIIGLNYVFAIIINMFLRDIQYPMCSDGNSSGFCSEEGNMMERKFNTLGVSMWSLALHGTFMDAISDLLEDMRDLENLETGGGWVLAWSMIFVFFLYVLLTNITVMNMLIGIVCEVVSEVKLSDEKNTAVVYLKRNLRNLLIELDEDNNNQISKRELNAASKLPRAREVLKELDVNVDNLIVLTEPLFEQDADAGREQEVTREELLNVILDMRGDRDVRMEDIVELRCDIRRFVHRQTNELVKKTDEIAGHIESIERNCLQDKHQREKSCIWLFQVSVSVAVECAISQSRQLDIKGKDAVRLQTALQAAQGLLLDVEVQWGQQELTKVSSKTESWQDGEEAIVIPSAEQLEQLLAEDEERQRREEAEAAAEEQRKAAEAEVAWKKVQDAINADDEGALLKALSDVEGRLPPDRVAAARRRIPAMRARAEMRKELSSAIRKSELEEETVTLKHVIATAKRSCLPQAEVLEAEAVLKRMEAEQRRAKAEKAAATGPQSREPPPTGADAAQAPPSSNEVKAPATKLELAVLSKDKEQIQEALAELKASGMSNQERNYLYACARANFGGR
ncbi:CACNA1H [Symbiodinium sp. KB8]|nr:CACNA1H [Symbiodinium sp. KB8]